MVHEQSCRKCAKAGRINPTDQAQFHFRRAERAARSAQISGVIAVVFMTIAVFIIIVFT